jgi:hypothetical protein
MEQSVSPGGEGVLSFPAVTLGLKSRGLCPNAAFHPRPDELNYSRRSQKQSSGRTVLITHTDSSLLALPRMRTTLPHALVARLHPCVPTRLHLIQICGVGARAALRL